MEIRLLQDRSFFSPLDLDTYLPQINQLINDAYATQDRTSYGPDEMFPAPRIKSLGQLEQELGPTGLAAVAFDTVRGDEKAGRCPVAIVCLKPWKGKAVDLWQARQSQATAPDPIKPGSPGFTGATSDNALSAAHNQSQTTPEWEVALCASVKNPQYRGQGLITRCLDTVVQRMHLLQNQGAAGEHFSAMQTISLWVTALEGVGNAEYWQRRGFVRQGEPDIAPAGFWDSIRPFRIGTLKKVLA